MAPNPTTPPALSVYSVTPGTVPTSTEVYLVSVGHQVMQGGSPTSEGSSSIINQEHTGCHYIYKAIRSPLNIGPTKGWQQVCGDTIVANNGKPSTANPPPPDQTASGEVSVGVAFIRAATGTWTVRTANRIVQQGPEESPAIKTSYVTTGTAATFPAGEEPS